MKKPTIDQSETSVLVTIKHESLASPEQIVMECLSEHDEIDNKTARELCGIRSPDQMKQIFYNLRDKGLLIKNPDPNKKGKKSTWIKTQ